MTKFSFQCPTCGTVRIALPADATETTRVQCADCQHDLGVWGDIQDAFLGETAVGGGAFEIKDGQFEQVVALPPSARLTSDEDPADKI